MMANEAIKSRWLFVLAAFSALVGVREAAQAAQTLPIVSLSVMDPNAAEPGPDEGSFQVRRTGITSAPLKVFYTIGGTATSGADYEKLTGSLTIVTGAITGEIRVKPKDDLIAEGDETVILTLSPNIAYIMDPVLNTGTVTIADDEPIVSIATTDAIASEPGANTGTFTVRRDRASQLSLKIYYTISGTAVSGIDYLALPGFVTIGMGGVQVNVIVTPRDDSLPEGDETVVLTLVPDPRMTYSVAPGAGTAFMIIEDDEPMLGILATDPVASEPGTDTGTFTLTRAGNRGIALTVNYRISGSAINGVDYKLTGTFDFPSNVVTKTLTVTPINDLIYEGTEPVIITLFPTTQYSVDLVFDTAVVTIDDNEPLISIEATDATASEPGTDTGTLTLTRTGGPTMSSLTVYYSVGGSATNGADYTTLPGSVTFGAGFLTTTIRVVPIDDQFIEGDETVTLTLIPYPYYGVDAAMANATVTIADDEPIVSVVATDPDAAEPAFEGTLTISRTGKTTGELNVFYTITGTATNGVDYVAIASSVKMGVGVASVPVKVTPKDDALPEGDETVVLTLTANSAYGIGTPTDTVTIADDEPVVSIAATDDTATEPGTDTATFMITRSGGIMTSALTVNYTVTGTATNGIDYATLPGSVMIPAGSPTVKITVTPKDDTIYEPTESVVLTLVPTPLYSVAPFGGDTATATIADNEPVVSILAMDAYASEPGTDTGLVTFTRTGSTANELTVYYTIGGSATNGADYVALAGWVRIPALGTTTTITIKPIDDAIAEGDETLILTLAPDAAYGVDALLGLAMVIIADDEPVVSILATDPNASEPGTDTGTLTLARTGPTSSPLTVYYAAGGTATAGTDYYTLAGSVVFPAGAQTATITVIPKDDAIFEPTETVDVAIAPSPKYGVDGVLSSATVNIMDNEPIVSILATDPNASEPGTDTGAFVIKRTGGTASELVVNYTIAGTATNGTDYVTLPGSVRILAGSSSVAVKVMPKDDTIAEGEETVIVTLSADPGYEIEPTQNTATVTMADNEPTVSIEAISPAMAAESGAYSGTFVVARTASTASELTVSYTITGTATNGTDYTALSGSIKIPVGSSSVTIKVVAKEDTTAEGDETVTLTLNANAAYWIDPAKSTATVTIVDNEPVLAIDATDATGSEPGTDTGSFTIANTLGNVAADLTVNYTVTGTATNGTDYAMLPGSAIILKNSSSVKITVTPKDDTLVEGDETVILTLATSTKYLVAAGRDTATVTIVDNEPVVSILGMDAYAAEPGTDTGTFTVSRTGSTASALTVNYSITGTATNGTDYVTLPASVTIQSGANSASITVKPKDDILPEGNETVILTLTASAAYAVSPTQNTATVTIADDEPMVSIAATDPYAAEPGTDTGTFTVTRTGSTASDLTVNYAITGSATNGTDYTTIATSVKIPAGSATAGITVTALPDAVAEGEETVILTLSASAQYSVDAAQNAATVVISDGSPIVSVSASDPNAAEAGLDPGAFTIKRTRSTTAALTVNYTVSGTATNGTDYQNLSGSVAMAPEVSSAVIPVTPKDDALPEGNETVILTLSANAAYTIDPAASSATVTIADDESVVSIVASDLSASEPGTDTGTFTLRRTGSTAAALTVTYNVTGTATLNTDYTVEGSFSFAVGSSVSMITIKPTDDALAEGTETVTLTLTANAAYALDPAQTSATVVIVDDEPVVSIAASDAYASEPGTNTGAFTVRRTGSTTAALTVNYTVSGTAMPAADYLALSGSVVIPASSATAEITVTPLDDALVEGDETVIVTLAANPAYGIEPSQDSATVTIADDEPVVSIAASDAYASEFGNDTGTLVVARTGSTVADLTVTYTIGGTATNTTDYNTLSGSVVIPAKSATAAITVTPKEDSPAEPDETAILTLSASAAYAIDVSQASAMVIIADGSPVVSITATDANAAEKGLDTATFTVKRTRSTTAALTVGYTISGTATNGTDYNTLSGSVVIPAGSATATITVTPIDDLIYEEPETVILSLSNGVDYWVDAALASATATIADNEPTVSVAATDPTAAERGPDAATFTVTRSATAATPLTVLYALSGTATNGTDYDTLSGSVTILANATTAKIVVTPKYDTDAEGPETVIVTLSSDAAYGIDPGKSTATATIADGGPGVSIAATDPNAAEQGLNPGEFTITRSGDTSAALTVTYTITGTATNGVDYNAITTSAQIPIGSATKTIAIVPKEDQIGDGAETVILTLSVGTTYNVDPAHKSATVTIADNEPVVSVVATDANAAEQAQDPGVFTVSRTGDTAKAMAFTYTLTGTATNSTDYTVTGASTFAALSATATITITPKDDVIGEPAETVILTLTRAATSPYSIDPNIASATLTIADNEAVLSVEATDPDAAEQGTAPGVFTVSRTGDTAKLLAFTCKLTGTATNGSDYTVTGASSFAAGSGTATITITPKDDLIGEPDETVILTLTRVVTSPYLIDPDHTSATVTIADNEPLVKIEPTDPDAAEQGRCPAVFTVTRTGGDQTKELAVTYTVSGTAVNGTDYDLIASPVKIPANQASKTITITPKDDLIYEPSETAIVTLSRAGTSPYSIDPALNRATVTIADNESIVGVAAMQTFVPEDGSQGPGLFAVWRTGTTDVDLRVNYTITGTAANGTDYTTVPAFVTIPTACDWAPIVIAPINDALPENDETVIITLTANAAYSIDPTAKTDTLSIEDNDTFVGIFAMPDASAVWENWQTRGSDPAEVVIWREGGPGTALNVTCSIGGTAINGTDYQKLATSVTIPAGQTWTAMEVKPINDALVEHDETVIFTLAASTAYTIDPVEKSATVIIIDDDAASTLPLVSIVADVLTVWEDWQAHGENPGRFTISRADGITTALRVNYTIGGTATNGTDYTAITTFVTIPIGSASASVLVSPKNDATAEESETVALILTASATYTIDPTNDRASVEIEDDDVVVGFETDGDSTVWENWEARSGSPAQIAVWRTGRLDDPLTIHYTVDGTATEGADYVALSGIVTIPADAPWVIIEIEPVNDGLLEGDEAVALVISTSTDYTIWPGYAVGAVTILDDEQAVSIAATDASASEQGLDPGTFTVTRTGSTASALLVSYLVSGTATNGTDYEKLLGTVTIPAGSASATITVTPKQDTLKEPGGETVIVTVVANGRAYSVDPSLEKAIVVIADND